MTGQEIREIRTKLGWAQARLAREIGVDTCTVNRWENGHSKPLPVFEKKLELMKRRTAKPESTVNEETGSRGRSDR